MAVKIKIYIAGKDKIADFKKGDKVKFKNGAIAEVLEDKKLGKSGILRKRFQIVSSGSEKKKVSATKKSAVKKPKKSAVKKPKKSAVKKPKKSAVKKPKKSSVKK